MRNRFLAALCLALSILPLFSCSKDNPTESIPSGPAPLTLYPSSGPPMTTVTLSGIDPAKIDLEECYIVFDTILSGILFDSLGTVTSTVPAVFDSTTGWAVTGQTLSVAIISGITEDTVAFGADLFTVTALPPAPGTTSEMISNLSKIHRSIKDLTDALYPTPNIELGLTDGFLNAFDSIANGVDSLCLPFMLTDMQNNDPDGLALFDALLASSGMAEQTSEFASIISAMADSGIALAKMRSGGNVAATTLTDEELAWKMQFYVVLKQFGNTVIKPTAGTYSKIHGFFGILTSIPLSSLVSAALSLTDFIVNKFVVGLLPAKIDDMTLDFDSDTITMGDQTTNTLMIYASNDPPPISILDVTKLILTGLGLKGAGLGAPKDREFETILDFLERVTLYVLKLFRSELAAFKSANPEVALDVNLVSLPSLSWEAEITDKKFVELETFTQNIIEGDAGEPRWVSLGPDWGEGRVYARTTVDPGAIVIPQPPGFAYSGGAFGEDVERTETKSVWVKPNLVLKLTMPQSVDEVNFEPVKIVAGYEILIPGTSPITHSAGLIKDTIWSSNIDLTLNAGGGNLQLTTGTTDVNGEFSTGVKLNNGVTQLTVNVDADGDVDSHASTQGTAGNVTDPIAVKAIYGGSYPQAMPVYSTRFHSRVSLVSSASKGVGGVTVSWTSTGATVTPVTPVSDPYGLAAFDVIIDKGVDSAFVFAKADAGNGNIAKDTVIIYSYCLPPQACTYSEGGSGTYTANGSCLSGSLTASAAVGNSSGAEVRIEDGISVIAADSTLWTEDCIVWVNVNYSWSISGGSQTAPGIEASLSSPSQYDYTFASAGSGADLSDAGSAVVPVRGIPLAPWRFDSILSRFRATAIPNPLIENNTAISNTLNVQITGINRVTLMDGETQVKVLCAQTSAGLTYSSP